MWHTCWSATKFASRCAFADTRDYWGTFYLLWFLVYFVYTIVSIQHHIIYFFVGLISSCLSLPCCCLFINNAQVFIGSNWSENAVSQLALCMSIVHACVCLYVANDWTFLLIRSSFFSELTQNITPSEVVRCSVFVPARLLSMPR